VAEIEADATAALGAALDADNFDLAAEVLWTWPMLGLPWNAAAAFGFAVLADEQDARGFLRGPGYTDDAAAALPPSLRGEHVLRTSYHADFVFAFLCAASLRDGREPPLRRPHPAERHDVAASCGLFDVIVPMLRSGTRCPSWLAAFEALDPARRAPLAEVVLAIALRRARSANDLAAVRACLSAALRHDVVDGPAPRQAVMLLRRAAMVG
jgi:hypothetical protein